MRTLRNGIDRLSRAAAYLSGLILVLMVLHILLEITLRTFFATSTFVLDEFVGYGIAAMTYLTLAFALREGALIRVNLMLVRARGRVRLALEVLCVAMTLALTLFLAGYFWRTLLRDFERGTVSYSIAEVPLWIPEGLVFIGLVLFALQLFSYLVGLLMGERPIETDVAGN